MVFHPTAISHAFWGVLLLMAGIAVYRKSRETDIAMVDYFWRFFLLYAGFFLGTAGIVSAALLLDNQFLLGAGYWIPHFLVFLAFGYLWKVQSSILFPQYEKLFWAFFAYGLVMTLVGFVEQPTVFIEGASQYVQEDSLYFAFVPGMVLGVLAVAASSYWSAHLTSGDNRNKLLLIGTGTLLALAPFAADAIAHDLWIAEELAELLWIGSFLAAVYWDSLKPYVSRTHPHPAPHGSLTYRDVFTTIVKHMQDAVGPVAIAQANNVEDITIDDTLTLDADNVTQDDIIALVDVYKGIMGDGAYAIVRQAVTHLEEQDREALKELALPADILPADLKAEEFAESL